jgi:1,4-dihydroxy-2-naphthoyl-CoA hydrolase
MSDNQPANGPADPGRSASEAVSTAEFIQAMSLAPLVARLGIIILEASPQRLVATMPVEGNTQPYGQLHGGASCALAETLGSVGAVMHARPLGKIAVGIDINATHHRSASSGLVTATATALSLGGSLASYEIVIVDDTGRRICTARITCMLRPMPT